VHDLGHGVDCLRVEVGDEGRDVPHGYAVHAAVRVGTSVHEEIIRIGHHLIDILERAGQIFGPPLVPLVHECCGRDGGRCECQSRG
jgi:hypothetical protein